MIYYKSENSGVNAHTASALRRSDSAMQARMRALEEQVDRLFLINEALWRLLSEKMDLEEIDLIEKVTEIDLEMRNGVVVWDVELSNGVEIYVDATSGIRLEIDVPGRDDDDDWSGGSDDSSSGSDDSSSGSDDWSDDDYDDDEDYEDYDDED